jgi:hypothetical protein
MIEVVRDGEKSRIIGGMALQYYRNISRWHID